MIVANLIELEKQLEPQISQFSPEELTKLANWLLSKAQPQNFRDADPNHFTKCVDKILREHSVLLKKLAE